MSDQIPEGSYEIPQGLENQGPPDHSEYIPPAATVEPNAGETGLEISNEQTGGDNTNDSNSTGNESTGRNPAWNPLFEKVPTPFHGELQPILKQWDDNFQQVQSQLAPFKPFIEQQISPQAIQNSLQLAKLFNANPKLVYDQLGERFGFNSGQGQSEVGGDEGEDEDNEESNFENPLDNPNLKPYIEQQQQIAEYLQQQQEIAQEQALDRQVAAEWSAIEKKHGGAIPTDVKTEMIRRAIWIADQQGKEPVIEDGYNDYNAFVLKVRGQKANNTAPKVFSGNGGLPSTPTGITADMSDEERIAYIAQRAASLNSQS